MYEELKAALQGAILDPTLALEIAKGGFRVRRNPSTPFVKTLVGTHHKVLTSYMARVSRGFAVVAGRSFSRGTDPDLAYDKEVIHDYHSTFDLGKVGRPFRGIHIRRDPRDILVSCAHYHVTSSETWLHQEGYWGLSGTTYQKTLRSMKTMDERLLFELDHAGGRCISRLVAWDYTKPEWVELQYENLVGADGLRYVRERLDQSRLFSVDESDLLEKLFNIFSARGVVANRKHMRNPNPSQWKEHFTARVQERFNEKFGAFLAKLDYE